jgi:hypothetical protein
MSQFHLINLWIPFVFISYTVFSQQPDSAVYKVEKNGLIFKRYVQMYEQPQTCEVKPPGFVAPKAYSTHYTIIRKSDEKLLLNVTGETYFQNSKEIAGDPIVKDIDFDGVLDLWIPAPEKKGYKFYSFNPSLDNFEMNFLSKLYDLKIDTEKQRATGYTYDYEFYGGAPDSKTEYVLQGKNLPVVKKQIIPLN